MLLLSAHSLVDGDSAAGAAIGPVASVFGRLRQPVVQLGQLAALLRREVFVQTQRYSADVDTSRCVGDVAAHAAPASVAAVLRDCLRRRSGMEDSSNDLALCNTTEGLSV